MTAAFPPPPPTDPPAASDPPPGPPSSGGPGWVLVLVGGILVTGALLAGVFFLWPSGGDEGGTDPGEVTATTVLTPLGPGTSDPNAQGEPSATTDDIVPEPPVDLFASGAQDVYAELVGASRAGEVLELIVYPEYAFLAYRDPAHPANIDERQWRGGKVSAATPNTGDDRYDADTAAKMFKPADLSLAKLSALVDDAPRRFTTPVEVTHVIVDRFLPFDQRVLFRVYTAPTDGRSGGGYVEYAVDGTYVKTVG